MTPSPRRSPSCALALAACLLAGCRSPEAKAPWNRDDRQPLPAAVEGARSRPSLVRTLPSPTHGEAGPAEAPAGQRPVGAAPQRSAGAETPRRGPGGDVAPRAGASSQRPPAEEAAPAPPQPPEAPPAPATSRSVLEPGVQGVLDVVVDAAFREHGLPSVAVGVVHGEQLVYTRVVGFADVASQRAAEVDTIYNVGSITKVFTTTLLGSLRDEGLLQLDDAVARYLPAHVRLPTDPRGERAITLRHLATHTSGLPGEPINLTGPPDEPWDGYTVEQLYQGLPDTPLVAPIGAEVAYSNLGMALLGHVLARASGKNYSALLHGELLSPLGMVDSGLQLRDDQKERYATGYREEDGQSLAVRSDLGCLAPAGGLLSTVPDLARFLSLQFHAGEAGVVPVSGGTLAETQRVQRLFDESWRTGLGLGWYVDLDERIGPIVRHNGGMGGHRGHVSFSPRHEVGVIVLSNRGWRSSDNPVADLGVELLALAVQQLTTVGPELAAAAEAIAEQLRTGPDDRLEALFHPLFLERMPLKRLERALYTCRESGVRCTGIESMLPAEERGTVRVIYRMEQGGPLTVLLGVDPLPPHTIVALLFETPVHKTPAAPEVQGDAGGRGRGR